MKVAGLDVSKETLDCRTRDGEEFIRVENAVPGCLKLIKLLQKQGIERVILEASGGYERCVCRMIWSSEIPLSLVTPRLVRSFARSMGRRAKNDKIDAEVLMVFGEKMDRPITPPPAEEVSRIRGLVSRRFQLMQMISA